MAATAVGDLPAASPQLPSKVDTRTSGMPPWLSRMHAPPLGAPLSPGQDPALFPSSAPPRNQEIPVNHGTWKLRSSCPWTGCSKDFSFAHKATLFHDTSEEGVFLLWRRQRNSVDAAEEECEMPFSL